MLRGISKVRIGVRDQERAKRFWTETLGCDVVQDETYGDERWLEVRLPDGVVLASEPYDDDPGWADIPDRHLVTVAGSDVELTPLKGSV